jgi:hypothetical protein
VETKGKGERGKGKGEDMGVYKNHYLKTLGK